jgi:hypothetical protein
VETTWLDCSAYYTPWSSTSIQLYISSCLGSCFSDISSEALFRAAMMKLKSSKVRMVCILVIGDFDLFQEEGFGGETFLFFEGSSSSLGSVTSPFLCFSFVPYISLPSPPFSGDMESVFTEALLKYCTSSIFFFLLGPGVSYATYGMSMSDISAGSARIRRSVDHSLVISSKSSSVSL